MKRYAALARVSSREQEREGFSLDVQEDALRKYAANVAGGGTIVKLFRIAETASKTQCRKTFRELLDFARANASTLDSLLFYKVDRAARNLFDYVKIEELERDCGVTSIFVSQPTENTPAGRMMRRTLANMATFYTEQQAKDVTEGIERRAMEGWFVGLPPYGYATRRVAGRSIVVVDQAAAAVVRRIYQLYAYEPLTLETLRHRLHTEGVEYRSRRRDAAGGKFSKSQLHAILTDRAYIGELCYKGQWRPGNHDPLIDRAVWERAQSLLRGCVYHAHTHVYAGGFMTCGHCSRAVTGETRTKRLTRGGTQDYTYYRCSGIMAEGHPRVRLTEADVDRQVMAAFERAKINDPEKRKWFADVIRWQVEADGAEDVAQRTELQRQHTLLTQQQRRVLTLRMDGEIDADTFAAKQTELRDRVASIKLQLDSLDRINDELVELAAAAFGLSQDLSSQWLTSDYAAKRRILEIVCSDCRLDGVSLCLTMRKPFAVLAEGLVSSKESG